MQNYDLYVTLFHLEIITKHLGFNHNYNILCHYYITFYKTLNKTTFKAKHKLLYIIDIILSNNLYLVSIYQISPLSFKPDNF